MSWLSKILGKASGETVAKLGDVATKFADGHLGKKELLDKANQLIAAQNEAMMEMISAEIGAKERIMVAELQQGDTFTKRARPSIIYVGLLGAIVDAIGYFDFTLPSDFWYVWGGVCGVYAIGRSVEKVKTNGTLGKIAGVVTGKKNLSILND